MQSRIFKLGFLVLFLSTILTGCEVIGDIFQAGMTVGIIIVIAVIVLIVWLISRFRK